MDSNEIRYNDVRSKILNGDVLLYKGKGFISRLIKLFTHSAYSHAGLAVWWNERLMVMEAVSKGVVVTPLSRNIEQYHGDVDWYASREPISEDDRIRLARFAQRQLGKGYSHWGVFLIAVFIALKRPFDRDNTFYRSKRLFCSFYVAESYDSIERDLRRDKADRFTTPDDIARSPLLMKNGVLKKEASH
jgi:hypothetical protein